MTTRSQPIRMADLTGTTPFPNYLLDTVMPTLTDTQWRLLCVVVRQTLGWQIRRTGPGDTGQRQSADRKSADWLTHGQLKARTGRSSVVLCRALDTLVRRNLLEVRDSRQQPLLTPRSRQRYGGRLYFRLGPAVLAQILKDYPKDHPVAGTELPGTAHPEYRTPKSEKGFIERGFQKVRITKAIPTKYLSNDKETVVSGSLSRLKNFTNGTSPSDLPNPDVKRFLAAYIRLFRQHTLSGDPPVIVWGKDGQVAKDLLKLYSYDRLQQLLRQFFESRDSWLVKRGYSLMAFKEAVNSLLVGEGNGAQLRQGQRPVLRTGRWRKAGENCELKQHQTTLQ